MKNTSAYIPGLKRDKIGGQNQRRAKRQGLCGSAISRRFFAYQDYQAKTEQPDEGGDKKYHWHGPPAQECPYHTQKRRVVVTHAVMAAHGPVGQRYTLE